MDLNATLALARTHEITLATGLRTHVREWDARAGASAPTVLLLHGFLDNGAGFLPLVAAGLNDSLRVIAPDLRGHGDTARAGGGSTYHFLDYVADVDGLIDLLCPQPTFLLGHSMGGTIASYYAGSFPEKVAALALLEGLGPPEGKRTGPERTRDWVTAWRRLVDRPVASYATVEEAAVRMRSHDPRMPLPMARVLATVGTTVSADGRRYFKHDKLHLTPSAAGFDVAIAARFWERITCPVLIVEGADSELRYDAADRERRLACFPTAEKVTLPDAGHMMQRHQPAALTQRLQTFFAGLTARAVTDDQKT